MADLDIARWRLRSQHLVWPYAVSAGEAGRKPRSGGVGGGLAHTGPGPGRAGGSPGRRRRGAHARVAAYVALRAGRGRRLVARADRSPGSDGSPASSYAPPTASTSARSAARSPPSRRHWRTVGSSPARSWLTSCADHRYGGAALCKHLANPQWLAGVKVVRLGRSGDDTSVLQDLSERIYNIRNRIVHAKQISADVGEEPLFPFAEESKTLQPDIEVLRYVAAAVLIESATSIG